MAGETLETTRWGKVPAWWLRHPGVDADRFCVLAALATYADAEGLCEPSQATIARWLKRSRPWVNRVVADLSATGLLRKEGRARSNGGTTSCRYQLARSPEEAVSNAVEAAEHPVTRVTTARPFEDRPRHRPDTSQVDLEHNQNPRPDARAADNHPSASKLARRAEAETDRPEIPIDWEPPAEVVAEAQRLCPDADLVMHTAHFVARCRSKGYRYAAHAVGDAWLAWLLEDRRRDARQAVVGAMMPSRSHRPGNRGDERFDAWAAAASTPRAAAWS